MDEWVDCKQDGQISPTCLESTEASEVSQTSTVVDGDKAQGQLPSTSRKGK